MTLPDDAERVDLDPPIGGYCVVYLRRDDVTWFYDEQGAEIRSLTVDQQGEIVIAAERNRPAPLPQGPPPRAAGRGVRHSRNTGGYQRARMR